MPIRPEYFVGGITQLLCYFAQLAKELIDGIDLSTNFAVDRITVR